MFMPRSLKAALFGLPKTRRLELFPPFHSIANHELAEHKLFCLFPRTRTPAGKCHLPAKRPLFEEGMLSHAQSASERLADYGRKARNRAFSSGSDWFISMPI
jgi:hypothetical protein